MAQVELTFQTLAELGHDGLSIGIGGDLEVCRHDPLFGRQRPNVKVVGFDHTFFS